MQQIIGSGQRPQWLETTTLAELQQDSNDLDKHFPTLQAIAEKKLEEKGKFIARENRTVKECEANVSRIVSPGCITSDHTHTLRKSDSQRLV